MKKQLSRATAILFLCASGQLPASEFIDVEPTFTDGKLLVPKFTVNDTDSDGDPDKFTVRWNIYTPGTKTKLLSTTARSARYRPIPCVEAAAYDHDVALRYDGIDGKSRRHLVLDLNTSCQEKGTEQHREAHRAMLYTANVKTGSSWMKSWADWAVVGAGMNDWDKDGKPEIQLVLSKGGNGRVLFIQTSDGAVESDKTYPLTLSPPEQTGLTLTSADQPGVGPCPKQGILTDPGRLAALTDALGLNDNPLIYLDVPYDGGDPDIFKKKCGLEGYWDPTDNVDEITATDIGLTPATVNLVNLLNFGNAGICTSNFTNADFGTGEGFPATGVYRKELKVPAGGTTYHVRFRVTAGGTAAGNSFASEGITTTQMKNTLVYKVNGESVAYANLTRRILKSFDGGGYGQAPTMHYTVQETAGGPVIFRAKAELICAAKL